MRWSPANPPTVHMGLLKPFTGRRSVEDLGLYILPQEFIPRNATFLDQTRQQIVAAASTVVIFEYRVPANRRGVLRRLAVDTIDPGALPNFRYSVLRSGAPVPNYQNEELPIGTIGTPDVVRVDFDREQLLQVSVVNSAAFGFEVHARVVAWFWDVMQEAGR